jgi:hypothetical protein
MTNRRQGDGTVHLPLIEGSCLFVMIQLIRGIALPSAPALELGHPQPPNDVPWDVGTGHSNGGMATVPLVLSWR